jgi:hypothetical protein
MTGTCSSRPLLLIVFVLCLRAIPVVGQEPQHAPETFAAQAQAENRAGVTASAPILIHLERYTPAFDRTAVEDALRFNGYLGFVPALRKAPDVGYVEAAGRKVTIRWARETPSDTGRTIVVVTDKPLAFVGGGPTDAKSRVGYEVAVIQLKVDGHGSGTGTMAAAARVKPGGETGVQIDDYAETPIALAMVTRK